MQEVRPTPYPEKPHIYLECSDSHGIELAHRLDLPVANRDNALDEWHLVVDDGVLTLVKPGIRPFRLSEEDIHGRLEGAKVSALAKACAARGNPRILDGLGGWGFDALVLGSLGCRVKMIEINPLVCAMAKDFCYRLGLSVEVVCGDVVEYLKSCSDCFDVVYLDPIFPPHPTNALPARRMQVLESLAKTDTDLVMLFELAQEHAPSRVAIKHRRNQLSVISNPNWQIESRTVRFDVYGPRLGTNF